MPLESASTGELCERARRVCGETRDLVQQTKDIVTLALADAAAARRRSAATPDPTPRVSLAADRSRQFQRPLR